MKANYYLHYAFRFDVVGTTPFLKKFPWSHGSAQSNKSKVFASILYQLFVLFNLTCKMATLKKVDFSPSAQSPR